MSSDHYLARPPQVRKSAVEYLQRAVISAEALAIEPVVLQQSLELLMLPLMKDLCKAVGGRDLTQVGVRDGVGGSICECVGQCHGRAMGQIVGNLWQGPSSTALVLQQSLEMLRMLRMMKDLCKAVGGRDLAQVGVRCALLMNHLLWCAGHWMCQ